MGKIKCNGCTECCRWGKEPNRFKPATYLEEDEDGNCIHLTETGCGNHGSRPYVCVMFDCRNLLKVPIPQETIDKHPVLQRVLKAAKEHKDD